MNSLIIFDLNFPWVSQAERVSPSRSGPLHHLHPNGCVNSKKDGSMSKSQNHWNCFMEHMMGFRIDVFIIDSGVSSNNEGGASSNNGQNRDHRCME